MKDHPIAPPEGQPLNWPDCRALVPFSFGGGAECFVYCAGCCQVARDVPGLRPPHGRGWFTSVRTLLNHESAKGAFPY